MSVYRKAQKAHHDRDAERWEEAHAAGTLAAGGGDANGTLVVPHVARVATFDVATAEGESPTGARRTDSARTLRSGNQTDDPGTVAVTYTLRSNGSNSRSAARETDVASALLAAGAEAGGGTTEETVVLQIDGVRRLTPTECERLQGLPDGWTVPWGPSLLDAPAWHELTPEERHTSAVPYDPPNGVDTPRRSGCGDAVCAAVGTWIRERMPA